MEMQLCKKCNENKILIEFVKNKSCKNGTEKICKLCRNKRHREKQYDKTDARKIYNRIKSKTIKYKLVRKIYRESNKEYYKKYSENYQKSEKRKLYNISVERKKQSTERTINLDKTYIRQYLKQKGFPSKQITSELIEAQKIIIKTKRLCKTLKS